MCPFLAWALPKISLCQLRIGRSPNITNGFQGFDQAVQRVKVNDRYLNVDDRLGREAVNGSRSDMIDALRASTERGADHGRHHAEFLRPFGRPVTYLDRLIRFHWLLQRYNRTANQWSCQKLCWLGFKEADGRDARSTKLRPHRQRFAGLSSTSDLSLAASTMIHQPSGRKPCCHPRLRRARCSLGRSDSTS